MLLLSYLTRHVTEYFATIRPALAHLFVNGPVGIALVAKCLGFVEPLVHITVAPSANYYHRSLTSCLPRYSLSVSQAVSPT